MVIASEAGPGLRWGLPALSERTHVVEAAIADLDQGMRRHVPIVVQAPSGAGKTTAVAAWLHGHPEWDVVWLTVTGGGWADVRNSFSAAAEVPPPLAGEEPGTWWARVLTARRAARELVVVLDGIDRLGDPVRLEPIVRMQEQLGGLTVVLVAREPIAFADDPLAPRVHVVSSSLVWEHPDAVAALELAGLEVPSAVVEALRLRAEGRAEAILACAIRWLEDRRRLPLEQRPSLERLVAEWVLARIEAVLGSSAACFLLLTASLIELPEELRDAVAALVPGLRAGDVDSLLARGALTRRASVHYGRGVLAITAPIAGELRLLARELEPERCRAAHAIAVEFDPDAGLAPYHRAGAGDARAAAAAVLERWRERRGIADESLLATLRTIPTEQLLGEPALAALRVAADRITPRLDDAAPTPFQDALLALEPDDLRVLDLGDRLLVEGAVVEVLLERNQPGAIVRRSGALADQQAGRIAELDARARCALAYLLVGVAEAHLALLRPDRAMAVVEPVLRLGSRDRWISTQYRACAVAALAFCFNGELDRMREKLLEADVYFGLGGYGPGPIQGFQWLTEFVDATHRGDLARTAALASRFAAFPARSTLGDVAADVVEAAALLAHGDAAAASASLGRVFAGPRFALQNPLTRGLVMVLSAEAYLADGRPGAVLDLLSGPDSPARHGLCLDAYRAAAHLSLGQPALALEQTRECVQPSLRHSAGTLAKVQALRAAAHAELRHSAAARSDMIAALHLAPPTWRASTFAMLPVASLATLRDLVADDIGADALAELDALVRDAAPRARDFPVALSPKETRLLLLLGSEAPLPEIARRLFVSINTVKTQTRSLYRKLGVGSRREAVDLAFSRGLGDAASLTAGSTRRRG